MNRIGQPWQRVRKKTASERKLVAERLAQLASNGGVWRKRAKEPGVKLSRHTADESNLYAEILSIGIECPPAEIRQRLIARIRAHVAAEITRATQKTQKQKTQKKKKKKKWPLSRWEVDNLEAASRKRADKNRWSRT